MKKPILCIDFDGVLHLYISGWTSPAEVRDGPVPGAMQFLEKVVEYFQVAVYSTRSHQAGGVEAMQKWLEYQLKQHFGPLKAASIYAQIYWPTEKPPAKVTLDDRAIQFAGVWPSMQYLVNFKPWNEKMKLPKKEVAERIIAEGGRREGYGPS
jgi:hypothetical protein